LMVAPVDLDPLLDAATSATLPFSPRSTHLSKFEILLPPAGRGGARCRGVRR
jgi:hypothetical protein